MEITSPSVSSTSRSCHAGSGRRPDLPRVVGLRLSQPGTRPTPLPSKGFASEALTKVYWVSLPEARSFSHTREPTWTVDFLRADGSTTTAAVRVFSISRIRVSTCPRCSRAASRGTFSRTSLSAAALRIWAAIGPRCALRSSSSAIRFLWPSGREFDDAGASLVLT